MVNRPSVFNSSNVLMVEGKSDLEVIDQIWRRQRNSNPPFEIQNKRGISELLPQISPTIRGSGVQKVGIVVDADDDVQGRWTSIKDRLNIQGLSANLPARPVRGGTIVNVTVGTGNPNAMRQVRVGVWIMPDNFSNGELENFLVDMIPPSDPVWPLSHQYVDGIQPQNRKFSQGKILRAKIHSWLAVRAAPRQSGLAILVGDLRTNGQICEKFTDWLINLFT